MKCRCAIAFIVLAFMLAAPTNAQHTKPKNTTDKILEIKNKKVCLRQDLTRGGAIYYISKSDTCRNIVNIYDEGRYIQQSYYAGYSLDRRAEGQAEVWCPWTWNPIQVGDNVYNRAKILDHWQKGNETYVKCIPMQWDMTNVPAEAVMEQWTSLDGCVVKVRNRLTCHRTDRLYGEGMTLAQEIPAVWLISALKNLYAYFGDKPFENEPFKQVEVRQLIMNNPDHFWGIYVNVPENWMAFTDDSGWGIAVYTPSACGFMAGRYESFLQGDEHHVASSYIAPVRFEALMKNSVMEYDYYLVIGSLEKMRKEIYRIHRSLEKASR